MIENTSIFTVKEIKNITDGTSSIAILVHNKITNIKIPHPITEFITLKYVLSGKSLNSQLTNARTVCRFLNFINESIEKKDRNFMNLTLLGLKGLELRHGSLYISYLTKKGLTKHTIKSYERTLTAFFLYLNEMNYINEDIIPEYQIYKEKKYAMSLFRNPKLQTIYPSSNKHNTTLKLKDFGKNRYELMILFIQIARNVAPDIAFGVCLQFYGGLRRGEIVNITKNDCHIIPYESMTIHIKDNRRILFNHLVDTSNECPKRTNYLPARLCKQIIMDTPLVWEVYNEHIAYNSSNLNNNNEAFFINKDGNPMSGKTYEYRFNKIKKYFLDELLHQGKYEDYTIMTESYWGTHIGRGIYSNILFDMKLTPTQIAIARGDTNINSALNYVDEQNTLMALKIGFEKLKHLKISKLGGEYT
ncbi:hypothetical protein [Vagococcus carniphilus]|uniref:hypothetical protein n=1 Tax=Vagococcus carniphilus TaxID=218144 RepID=UPI003B5B6E74